MVSELLGNPLDFATNADAVNSLFQNSIKVRMPFPEIPTGDASNSDLFELKYQKEHFAVVICNICSLNFIPPYYRKQIKYEQYKNEAVTTEVRKGNNWVKIQRHKLRFMFIQKHC